MNRDSKSRESKVRRRLVSQGYALKKSRAINLTSDDQGGYQIIDLQFGRIEAGERFNLTLEEVEQFAIDE